MLLWSWGNSVNIVSEYRLDGRGSILAEAHFFPPAFVSRPTLRPTQTIQWVQGIFSRGKLRPGRDADHSFASNAEAKNEKELYLLSPLTLILRLAGQLYLMSLVIHHIENSVSWVVFRRPASQEVPRLSCKRKAHYHFTRPATDPHRQPINPPHVTSYSLRSVLIFPSHQLVCHQLNSLFSSRLCLEFLWISYRLSPMRATCLGHRLFLHFRYNICRWALHIHKAVSYQLSQWESKISSPLPFYHRIW
jgi:hypothetical protein